MELNANGVRMTPAMAMTLIANSDNELGDSKLTWEMSAAQAFAIVTLFMDVMVKSTVTTDTPTVDLSRKLFPETFAGLPLAVKWELKEDEVRLLNHGQMIGRIHNLEIPAV